MGDPKDVKGKGQYHSWSGPEHKLLLRLLVDAINQGFRDASGKFNKLTVESRILTTLQKEVGSKKTYGQYKNRMKILKGRYQVFADFLRCSSGFGWDSETKKFTADDEVWKVYLQVKNYNMKFMLMLVLFTYDSYYSDFFNRLIQIINICVMIRLKILKS